MRTGINTGEVVAGDPTEGHAFATGDAVALAQRLEAAASPGEILIGEKTYRLVRDAVLVEPLEPLELKGTLEARERVATARQSSPERRPTRVGSTRRWSAAKRSSSGCARSSRKRFATTRASS